MAYSLRQFLAAMAADPQKMKEYFEDPKTVLKDSGLPEADRSILASGDAAAIAAALGPDSPAAVATPSTSTTQDATPDPAVWVAGDQPQGQPGKPRIGFCFIMDEPVCDPATWVVTVTDPCPPGPVTWVVKMDVPVVALQGDQPTAAEGQSAGRRAADPAIWAANRARAAADPAVWAAPPGPGSGYGAVPVFTPPPPPPPGPVVWSVPYQPTAFWANPYAGQPQPQPGPVIWVVPAPQNPGGQPAIWSVPPTWLRPPWGGPGSGGS